MTVCAWAWIAAAVGAGLSSTRSPIVKNVAPEMT